VSIFKKKYIEKNYFNFKSKELCCFTTSDYVTTKMILEFIKRRFPYNSRWMTGNCYHFALILSDAFDGEIYYDVVKGHFVTSISDKYYDYCGEVTDSITLVKWKDFDKYDRLLKERIIRDCVK